MKLMLSAWLASLFSGKSKPEPLYVPEDNPLVVSSREAFTFKVPDNEITDIGTLIERAELRKLYQEDSKFKAWVDGGKQGPAPISKPTEPELTPLQKLIKQFDSTKDLLVLCRKDYEQYLTDLEDGKIEKVDVTKIVSFQGLSNSAIVRCGWGGQFWA
ncbi:hypothetical protein D3C87_279280 [compost metagenome]